MATIGDVAKLAGVSRSTVSYVMSGKRPVSSEVRQRVQEVIKELDFSPSAAGRALATATTDTIALLAPMVDNAAPEVALQFVNGVVQAARRQGQDVLLATGDEAFHSVERLVKANQVDGFVVLDVEERDPRIQALRKANFPAVLVGMPEGVNDFDRVDLDWREVGLMLIGKLAQAGHQHICLVGTPAAGQDMDMTYVNRFNDGVQRGAQLHGSTLVAADASNDFLTTTRKIEELLRNHPEVTAFVVRHEVAAAPLFNALNAAGLSVPTDVSVLGVSLDTMSLHSRPISGVLNPFREITGAAVDLLAQRLEDPSLRPRTVLLQPEYDDRGTLSSPKH